MAYGEYFDPAMLDLMMGGFTGSTAPGGGRGQYTELDMSDLDIGPDDEFTGSTMQEFYDYLMKPRHRREAWSSPSGGMHGFGPAREASISPDNIAMADIIQKQMDEDRSREESERRVGRAESIMAGRGPGAGGMMSMPGKEPITIGPKPPMTPPEQAEAMAGGIPMEPLIAAEAKKTKDAEAQAYKTQQRIQAHLDKAAKYDLASAKFIEDFEMDREKYEGEGGQLQNYKDMSAQDLREAWKAGELPSGLQRFLGKHFIQWDTNERLASEARASAAALRENLGEPGARVDYAVTGTGEVVAPGSM